MGITGTPEQYEASLRKLFPRGSYWDGQFADPESDCSLFCRAKTAELLRFRKRMADLQAESVIQTAAETLEDWERVILEKTNAGLSPEQRRALLAASKTGRFSVRDIKEIGLAYGVTVTGVVFPYRPGMFGFSRFGADRIPDLAAFSVLRVTIAEAAAPEKFEQAVLSRVLGSHVVFFNYGGA